jgi:hypothetical protein
MLDCDAGTARALAAAASVAEILSGWRPGLATRDSAPAARASGRSLRGWLSIDGNGFAAIVFG